MAEKGVLPHPVAAHKAATSRGRQAVLFLALAGITFLNFFGGNLRGWLTNRVRSSFARALESTLNQPFDSLAPSNTALSGGQLAPTLLQLIVPSSMSPLVRLSTFLSLRICSCTFSSDYLNPSPVETVSLALRMIPASVPPKEQLGYLLYALLLRSARGRH